MVDEKPKLGRKCTMADCTGCRNDFYNGKNPYDVKECWSLESARMQTRYQLSVHTPMNQKSGYVKRRAACRTAITRTATS